MAVVLPCRTRYTQRDISGAATIAKEDVLMVSPCDLIAQQMGHLFACANVDGYIRIRTPFLYPDGDNIDIYFRENDQGVLLSDLGSTLMWLNTQTLVEKRTKRQLQIVRDVCVTHRVEFSEGALWLNVHGPTAFAESVTRLAQAALRVADISFTLRPRVAASIADEIMEFLNENNVPFRANEKLKGYSHKEHTIDFFTFPPKRDSFVALLSTGNPFTALELVEKTSGIWRDLDVLKAPRSNGVSKPPPKFVTLFDDTQEVWKPEHKRMLERDSDIAYWSDPSDFLRKLEAA